MTLRLPGTFERVREPTLSDTDAAKLEAVGKITLDTDARAEIARAVGEFPHNCAAPLATEIVLKREAVGADADRLFRQLAKLTTSEQQVDDNAHFYMLSLGAPRPSQKRRLWECLAPGTRTNFLAGLQTIRDAADLAAAKLTSGGGRSTKVARDQLISTALETYDHAALHKTAARCRNAFVIGVLKLAGAPEMRRRFQEGRCRSAQTPQ